LQFFQVPFCELPRLNFLASYLLHELLSKL
jgi:hypothetical protein